ncbi:MAG TPA: alpha/beta fold hydrolase [Saprospiraceae bacterium]|nr:alpha/beta fold hydrolase [Saprospiraceae bacterium]HND89162.1 alpha/beta fold hydrolase [Saprospiraceae bacterium]HNG88620.1 alpha/beta fold hydrolase [Saprospiraceae bacterium]
MDIKIKEEHGFRYIESGSEGPNLLLLHGLFGALSNFQGIIGRFSGKYNVVVPILPIYDMPIFQVSVMGLVDFVTKFVEYKGYDKVHLLGNSLGGHIAQLYALAHPERVASMTLTGSSGLFESAFGSAFPKRGDYEYIRKKTAETFYDPQVASKELVDEVFGIVNDRNKAIRVVATAKSAVRHNLADKLHQIKAPTLLVWGKQDAVTPPFVGEKFHELINTSQLYFLDHCGHAPMMEKPEEFNEILEKFLDEVVGQREPAQ